MASKWVKQARSRRAAGASASKKKDEWYIDKVLSKVKLNMVDRMGFAVRHVKKRVIQNISKPVGRTRGPRGGKVVTRSKPGEFPRADTTQLRKSIFTDIEIMGDKIYGHIGQPLDYGLFLELKMDRKFLSRTLKEEEAQVRKIMTGPVPE